MPSALTWEEVVKNFWARANKRGPKECWEWSGKINHKGYGIFYIRKPIKITIAHRFSYFLAHGHLPKYPGMELDHLCKNRRCVNPDHLEAVTTQENIRRGDVALKKLSNTHCPSGHEFSPENTRRVRGANGNYYRVCRTCENTRSLANYYAKKVKCKN